MKFLILLLIFPLIRGSESHPEEGFETTSNDLDDDDLIGAIKSAIEIGQWQSKMERDIEFMKKGT